MTILRLIGDVHGNYAEYLPLIRDAPNSIQVGDLGMDYRPLATVDDIRHRAIGGNHEMYARKPGSYWDHPQFLGDYGLHRVTGLPPIFYVRGAWSIDGEIRRRRMAMGAPDQWWADEECSLMTLAAAESPYTRSRPEIVVTHECPFSIVAKVTDPRFARAFGYDCGEIPTRTNMALQAMFQVHRPKLWVFGHYHTAWDEVIDGTRFVCLNQLGGPPSKQGGCYLDLDANSIL